MRKGNSNIFIAYEDADSFSAISKLAVVPEAMPRVPNQEEMDTVVFSEFWAEKSWGNAVAAASNANIIIVSLSGRANLPVPVRRWMESWPNYEQEHHTTLVAVFGTEPTDGPRQNLLISYFQKIAKDHGLDFLCHRDGAQNCPATPQSSQPADQMDTSHAERDQVFDLLAVPKAA